MANVKHLEVLARGRATWEQWRVKHPDVVPDLERADLRDADLRQLSLSGANLVEANLERVNLLEADLSRANLLRANLGGALLAGADLSGSVLGWANLSGAVLWKANLHGANLIRADLGDADLGRANLCAAELAGASLRGTRLHDTVLANVDLSRTEHLISCRHEGPSALDHRTLERSGSLPLSFLRGCGLPEGLIETVGGVLDDPAAYGPCFVCSDPDDLAFAQKVWADLQHEGVRCWLGADDPGRGESARHVIRHGARMILILSERSLASEWVEEEVTVMLEEAHRCRRSSLVTIRIDDAWSSCTEPWAARIHRDHAVRDFSDWRDRIAYQGALGRLLGDLRNKPAIRRAAVTSLSAARNARRRHAMAHPA
jgi:uncharacterized protein YjbI with pentapeptide repeats